MAPKSDMVAVRIEPELKDKLERHLAGLPGGVTLSQATRILIEWMEATRCDPATLMAETKAARLAAQPANGNGAPCD
jgi:hypothetical protein